MGWERYGVGGEAVNIPSTEIRDQLQISQKYAPAFQILFVIFQIRLQSLYCVDFDVDGKLFVCAWIFCWVVVGQVFMEHVCGCVCRVFCYLQLVMGTKKKKKKKTKKQ
eukprot:TRINITY_DN3764_c0_g1_i1.p5 TRINITY_DN3764_c0_g1~~TRINITY_DN3764_c0_g1_i1.p5  ORF type:complete len:108 (-),score=8.60 TRINITY_DN3764_c0_g1_i1:42-365(-)